MRQSFTHRGIEFKYTEAFGTKSYHAMLGYLGISVRLRGEQWEAQAIASSAIPFQGSVVIASGPGESPEAAIDAMCHNYAIIHRWLCREMIPTIQSAEPAGTKP